MIAAGVRPETSIVKDSPVKYNRGILVNQFMETNVSDIYAAGDVVESKNLLTGENCLLAIWPAAAKQGQIAGINMAGGLSVYEGFFSMNAVEIAELPVISFGIASVENSSNFEVLTMKQAGVYKKIVLLDNRIVGCIFLGRIERSGIYLGLMKYRIDVSDFKHCILDDNFGLLMLPENYRKHMVVGDGIEV
ncbi:MAG: FAD-dependent oxidoreductase [Candidatus Omnitrophica bacterium]|nr:FAD-dependent oxidoreductase [Candidatus Omnitrophota bacterium]